MTHSAGVVKRAVSSSTFAEVRARRRVTHASMTLVLPFFATCLGAVQIVLGYVDIAAVILMFVLVLACGLGIELGFHRLFSHNAFEATASFRKCLGILGTMAAQGPVIDWVASHRTHHRFSDKSGDLHSPHVDQLGQSMPAIRGLFHAHYSWLFTHQTSDYYKLAPDVFRDKFLTLLNRRYYQIVVLGLIIPGVIYAISFDLSMSGFAQGVLWGGFIRTFFVQNFTFVTNSFCHRFGKRHFRTNDRSTNVLWLVPVTYGASLHNCHHAFPSSAKFSLIPGQWDLGWGMIYLGRRMGLVSKATIPTISEIEKKLCKNPMS